MTTGLLLDKLDDLLPSGSAVLDVGCHDGELLARISGARPDVRVAGVDLDPGALDQARQRLPAADLHAGSAATLPFDNESFELVTCMDVVEHLPEDVRRGTFDEMRRVLKPGGYLLVETPHAGTFEALDAQNLRHRFPRMYRRLLGRGVRDRAYAGHQEIVWHHHFTRDELVELAGPGWRVADERYPGLLLWPLADLLSWPFHRTGRTDHRVAQWLRRASEWEARYDYGPRRGYEILLWLQRSDAAGAGPAAPTDPGS